MGVLFLVMFKCVNPLFINMMPVPCGKCYNCQMRKRAEWDFRLQVQSMYSVDSLFITLTYSDDNLEALSKRTLQLWFKDLRNKGLKFRYYAVGEYGERSGRQHYHVILFVESYSDQLPQKYSLYSTWTKGIMDIGTVSDASIHYVTKWHVHPKYDKDNTREKHGFTLQSKYLGYGYLKSLTKDNYSPYVRLNGNSFPLSRYYRKKLGVSVDEDAVVETFYQQFHNKYPHVSFREFQDVVRSQLTYSKNKQKSLRYEKI